MDDEELPEGETVEMDMDLPLDVEDTEDGGAIVTLDEDVDQSEGDFYDNLAETLPEPELNKLGSEFIEMLARDKTSRSKRDEQYEEGIRRTGLGEDAPGGAQFQGASKVVHPLLTEVCVDFSARAIKELFPPQGPVRDFIPGSLTPDKVAKAKRKTTYMNWQLTTQSTEFRAELEQLLTQVPLGGAQYLKITWNEKKNRPEFLFVAIDDLLLPFAATNFYSAQRRTHVQYLTALDFAARVKTGMYRDIDVGSPGMEPERSIVDVANDKIEGRNETSYNEDGLRTVFEIYTFIDIEDDTDGPAPYIVSVDKTSGKVLSIYRNWDEADEEREELQWIVEFPFVPWRGAYPIGLPHMIGGISAAVTGSLRALMDSAHISNSATMIKLKGGSKGGQSLNIQPTQVEEIEGGINVDDVRKLAMPLPFNPPSPVLFQLLGFLVDAGKGVVRTSMEEVGDSNPNSPVGTTLARLEQGMVVYSAMHARLHNSMARVLSILHRLNGSYMDDAKEVEELGEEIAKRADFEGPMDVVPVSDPNIFSESQRFAQVQAVAQRAAALPQLYNARKVEERILETLKVPNAKDLLNPAVEPQNQNAVQENVVATMGKPIVAFPEQDHIAHLKTHLAYMTNPALGMSELIAPTYLPVMIGHLKEHIALWYAAETTELADMAAGESVSEAIQKIKDPKERQAIDRMLAEASQNVVLQAEGIFDSLPPVIKAASEMMKQFAPQPPMDPASQAAAAETQRRQAADQAKMQLDGQKMQLTAQQAQSDAQRAQADAQLDAQRLQIEAQKLQMGAQSDAQRLQADLSIAAQREQNENQRTQAEIQARMAQNEADNLTALKLAELEITSGERFNVSTGTGINP
jgi:chaperonin GroES